MAEQYDIVSQNTQSTVVSHYEKPGVVCETSYQSEQDLERDLIDRLQRQGYEYLPIHQEAELVANLRRQMERLNDYQFTDGEWQRFFKTEIANEGKGIEDKAFTIQQDPVKTLRLDDGTDRNIKLIDKKDIHANSTQVINQYEVNDGSHPNRYDVTILVNGLPLVHIELKRRGVLLKEAFNQINRYGRDSFWAGNALFEYVQIFVISNGTETKYYSNTTRQSHIKEQGKGKPGKTRTCNSFEFTSYWSDAGNNILGDLEDFTATFFSRHTLLNVLTRFCVFTEQKILMAMRPYQIAATERLLNRIEVAHNSRLYGTRKAGGYVWHTTGSGKTLTSFKAALLATKFPYIDKVLFVVDRKDLDYQTMKEYDRFQKGAANGNTSTKELERQIDNPKSKIIITTIQKLSTYVKRNPQSEFYKKEVVMIFDECHRSQFGDMHQLITKRFKKYYLFGFTGTPIFAENISAGRGIYKTTEDVFGYRIHTYTIVDAIRDHNVLPFRVDYVKTMKEKEDVENSKVWDIEREKALQDPRRIHNVAQYILEHFDQQTKRSKAYSFSLLTNVKEIVADKKKTVEELRVKTKVSGFNSIFAVQNIPCAKLYYLELKQLMEQLPENKRLKIATIFSYAPNEQDAEDGDKEENSDNTEGLDANSREFLEMAIVDYNRMFGTSYDTSADKFPNYYKDVSLRMKNREIDILIVVNMFLTGFDATTLNTLWVDKNLRYHGLLQSYSRTNRILNSIKSFGNIVCFRNLEDATNKCLALFGDPEAKGITILRPFEDYFYGYTDEGGKPVKGYKDYLDELQANWEAGTLPLGEKAEKAFIRLFGTILKMRNLLSCFDQFAKADLISDRDIQDYTSVYLDLADKYRRESHGKEDICDDIVFEMELVKQVEVNIDYILYLVRQYHDGHQQDMEIRVKISKSIDSSPDLRDKKELIEKFIDSLTPDGDVDSEWKQYVNKEKRQQFDQIVEEEHLKKEKALEFIENAFQRGYVPEGGMELDSIMPPINPFDKAANRQGKIQIVLERIKAFFNKFFDISNGDFAE
ncbi:MAG: type I restriction endonuclease subunit R [Bacteroidetes bacterium]|uniref:Type I restriction enzyme endonuclease subunit n=1 Tax=Candidatus Limisoma faecipullorum TaxID=2840854 RepID=A0A9D9IQI3_9BACT|nr:type I restriction endonuclease subunit R [Candidatus Limisoma faecipullorum]